MKKSPRSGRGEVRVKVKKNKGLKPSSREWLHRQLNDPYVKAAKVKGYRSRAAFKLLELDEKFHVLKKGARVLDLGAAPGGWSQVAAAKGAFVVGADVLAMDEIPGVTPAFQADLTDEATLALLTDALGGPADLVLSDMAAPTTGHRETDHIRTTALVEIALEVAEACAQAGRRICRQVPRGRRHRSVAGAHQEKFPRRQARQAASEPRGIGGAVHGRERVQGQGLKRRSPTRFPGRDFRNDKEDERGLRRFVQADRADARRHVQALGAFDAERLQSNGFVEAAGERIGADTQSDCGLG